VTPNSFLISRSQPADKGAESMLFSIKYYLNDRLLFAVIFLARWDTVLTKYSLNPLTVWLTSIYQLAIHSNLENFMQTCLYYTDNRKILYGCEWWNNCLNKETFSIGNQMISRMCLCIPDCMRKIIWLLVDNIQVTISVTLSILRDNCSLIWN